MLINADRIKVEELSKEPYDICILGSGVACHAILQPLFKTNKRILIVESGDIGSYDYLSDCNSVLQKGYPKWRLNFENRLRRVGGTCELWAGRLVPMTFSERERLSWAELSNIVENYTQRTFEFFHIHSEVTKTRSFNRSALDDRFKFVEAYWSKSTPRYGKDSESLKIITESNNITLVYNLSALKLESFTSRNKSIQCITTKSKKVFNVSSRKLVLAMGGIENTNFLFNNSELLSKECLVDDTLLGSGFMDHPKLVHGELYLKRSLRGLSKVHFHKDFKFKIGIESRQNTASRSYINISPKKSEFIADLYAGLANVYKKWTGRGYSGSRQRNSRGLDKIIDLIYLLEPTEVLPHSMGRILSFFSAFLPGKSKYKIVNYLEVDRLKSNRLHIISDQVDLLGRKKLALTWDIPDKSMNSIILLHKEFDSYLREHGLGRLKSDKNFLMNKANWTDASHHIGGTPFSRDQTKRVVDENLKIKNSNNCYVVGSSVFPLGGIENPTFTIASLGLFVGDNFSND